MANEHEAAEAAEAAEAGSEQLHGHHHEHHIEVSISTTAGFYPAEGFNRVPLHQKVEEELHKAKHTLNIKDTAGWIATVTARGGKRTLDPAKDYRENGLSGQVEIDWGPSEGGGG